MTGADRERCALCGAERDPAVLTWVSDHDADGHPCWICPPCARRQLRDIEAKLSREWWS